MHTFGMAFRAIAHWISELLNWLLPTRCITNANNQRLLKTHARTIFRLLLLLSALTSYIICNEYCRSSIVECNESLLDGCQCLEYDCPLLTSSNELTITLPLFTITNTSIFHAGVRHSTYRDARGVAHSYFFSWEHAPTRNLEVDWLDARNICRRHCMDAVSLETPQVSTASRWSDGCQLTNITAFWLCVGCRKTNSSSKDLLAAMCATSGHRVASAILLAATVPTCSHQMRTAGSGRDRAPKSAQPASATPVTGALQVATIKHNQTTVRLPRATTNHAYRSWTISTTTVWNGTTSPAIIWSHSCAKTPTNCWTLCVHVTRAFVCRTSRRLLLVEHQHSTTIF